MNLYYIRAAIEAATGIKLNINEVKAYLISEGMITRSKAEAYTFRGYGMFFGDTFVEPIEDPKQILAIEGIELDQEDNE